MPITIILFSLGTDDFHSAGVSVNSPRPTTVVTVVLGSCGLPYVVLRETHARIGDDDGGQGYVVGKFDRVKPKV